MSTSGSEPDDDIPPAEVCQRLCEEFAAVTQTDSACAQFYLQDRAWNLERSVSDYFDDRRGGSGMKVDDDRANIVVVVDGSKESLAAAATAMLVEGLTSHPQTSQQLQVSQPDHDLQTQKPDSLKFISWNIDGIDEKNLLLRTKAVISYVVRHDADVVFLQEVVPASSKVLEKHLPQYKMVLGTPEEEGYYTAVLLKKDTVSYKCDTVFGFSNTSMGRTLTHIDVSFNGYPLTLMNTHLESTAEFSAARKDQLKKCFKACRKEPEDKTVIFAGDLNLRDSEMQELGGVPPGFEDMWESCGRRKEATYTWDLTRNDNLIWNARFKPRCRFDRVYLRRSKPARITPAFFGLIGLERLKPHTCFPSDHWGLLCHFYVT
ncbi:tyrosyl-DNA phosphodiesterase 2-like [Ornithodoros turicata]|uniref:tyrosyl-DNA phosphodiesterase 2-like n=1 Tax=Ornithodoros turicata TaxID=34597 RepID=UPI003139ACC7